MKLRRCSVFHVQKICRAGDEILQDKFEEAVSDALDSLTNDPELPSTIKEVKYAVTNIDSDDLERVLMSALIIYEYDDEEE
jgi:vacuolar-type H+-ATPase subunit E/Vma4